MNRKKIVGVVLICIFLMFLLVPMTVTSIENTKKIKTNEKNNPHLADIDADVDYDIYGGFEVNSYCKDGAHYLRVKTKGLFKTKENTVYMLDSTGQYSEEFVFYADITAKIIVKGEIKHEEEGHQFLGIIYGFDN